MIANDEIRNAILDAGGPDHAIELAHGYAYSAHPVACAAGIAALDVLQEKRMIERLRTLGVLA